MTSRRSAICSPSSGSTRPMDTEVNRFLIEFHRRQRAQLLVPAIPLGPRHRLDEGTRRQFGMVPSLSYASAFAAIALTAFLGLSQQVQVTEVAGQYKLLPAEPKS